MAYQLYAVERYKKDARIKRYVISDKAGNLRSFTPSVLRNFLKKAMVIGAGLNRGNLDIYSTPKTVIEVKYTEEQEAQRHNVYEYNTLGTRCYQYFQKAIAKLAGKDIFQPETTIEVIMDPTITSNTMKANFQFENKGIIVERDGVRDHYSAIRLYYDSFEDKVYADVVGQYMPDNLIVCAKCNSTRPNTGAIEIAAEQVLEMLLAMIDQYCSTGDI